MLNKDALNTLFTKEIVSIADETKDDVLDELQVLYDKLQEELDI
jgi:hypothetical protein